MINIPYDGDTWARLSAELDAEERRERIEDEGLCQWDGKVCINCNRCNAEED